MATTTTRQTTTAESAPGTVLPAEEGRRLFEREARRLLNMSGEEFLQRWDAGEYRQLPDTPATWKIMRVAYLIPFVRPDS